MSAGWYLQISAGTGPVEVRRFVALLRDALLPEIEARGLAIDAVTWEGEGAAPRSAALWMPGPERPALDDLLGTHVCVARSPERGKAARKRWFAGLTLHAAQGEGRALVDPADVEVTCCRAGGPGGRNVNKRSTAVRAVHRPTGLAVRVEGERSQHQNRAAALARLERLLAERQRRDREGGVAAARRAHHHLERGAPVRTWSAEGAGAGPSPTVVSPIA